MKASLTRARPRAGTGGSRRRRATIVAIACGAVVALVAASVFSIEYRSRKIVGQAVTLHSLNETLRSITIVRSQVAFAAYLASVDRRYGTDSSDVIDTSIADARRGLTDARAATAPLEDDDPSGIGALVVPFSERASTALTAIQSGRPGDARRITAELDVQFERARTQIVARRDTALRAITDDGDRLWRIGALASFVAAFVVPCGIVFVYISITRRSRASVEMEITLNRDRRRRERRREIAEAALRDLRVAIAASQREGTPVPIGLLDDLAAFVRATEGSGHHTFTAVPLDEFFEEISSASGQTGLSVTAQPTAEHAWTDRESLRHVTVNLLHEAQASGARRVALSCLEAGDHVQIIVAHDGAPSTREVMDAMSGAGAGYADADRDGRRASTRILAAVSVAESAGISLKAVSEPRPALMLRVARSLGAVTPDPTRAAP